MQIIHISDIICVIMIMMDREGKSPEAGIDRDIDRDIDTTAGSIKVNHLIYFYLTLVLVTPAYTYHMAVSQHQEPPYPHATVTNTACHYPQAQVFRWTMTSAGCFLTLIFHIVFRWFEMQAKIYKYPGSTYSYMYWPTMLSVIGYLIAIGTIDTAGTGNAHTIGAVYFFICLFFMVVNLTQVARNMRDWDPRFMKRWSLVQKMIVSIYLIGVFVYCLIGLALEGIGHPNDDDKYIVIIEWNLVYGGLIWILCFVGDFRKMYLCFNCKGKEEGGRKGLIAE